MKLTLQEQLGLVAAKFALTLSPQSTSAPGLAALKLAPSLLDKLLASIPEAPVFVTGTNGKSTTAGMLASIMEEAQVDFIHNRSGANLPSGLLTETIKNTDSIGQINKTEALLEIDEAVLRRVTKQNPAKVILVNNFFRDQLDRFGEMDQTINLVQEGIRFPKNPKETSPLPPSGLPPLSESQRGDRTQRILVLNCDDPNVCKLKAPGEDLSPGPSPKLGEGREERSDRRGEVQTLYFGIDPQAWQNNPLPEVFAEELGLCPNCGADLVYKKQWLGQFGDFICESCNYQKPEPDIKVTELKVTPQNSQITIEFPNSETVDLTVPLPGLFNVYNALGSAAVAFALGHSKQQIKNGIEKYQSLFGRSQEVEYKGKKLKIFLIKNPIGASEVLRLISTDPKAKVLVAINDNYADGRDVSWLWDAHFEYLANNKNPIYTTGTRGTDMAVRLKYAGIERITFVRELKDAINDFCESTDDENLYLIPTYTALLEITGLLGIGY